MPLPEQGDGRPLAETATKVIGEIGASVTPDEWASTFADARRWVKWNARRRWPDYPANDHIWAMSVTSWYHGGRRTA